VGIRGIPVGFSILTGACVVLWLLSVFRGHNRELLIVSSVLMTAGCASLAIARRDNLWQLWGLLILAGLGIGGIVVPASIISTFIVNLSLLSALTTECSNDHLPRRLDRHNRRSNPSNPRYWWLHRLLRLLQRLYQVSPTPPLSFTPTNFHPSKFVPAAKTIIGGTMVEKLNITDVAIITKVIELTGASLINDIAEVPGIKGVPGAWEAVVYAGQLAYAASYKYVYLVSIAFGGVSCIAACFLGDISKYMDDHVAVVM
jgi:hypothetical protein